MAVTALLAAGVQYAASRNSGGSSGSQSGSESYTRGSFNPVSRIFGLGQQVDRFSLDDTMQESRVQAQSDVSGVMDNLFKNYQEQALPDILGTQNQTGVFGSSTTQMLSNDAFARTMGQGAELTLGLAGTYTNQAMQRQQDLEGMLINMFQLDQSHRGSSRNSGRSSGMQSDFSQVGSVFGNALTSWNEERGRDRREQNRQDQGLVAPTTPPPRRGP